MEELLISSCSCSLWCCGVGCESWKVCIFHNQKIHFCLTYWAHVTPLTCKAKVQSTNTSHTWIDIVYTNHKRKGAFFMGIPQRRVLAGTEFRTCDHPTQIFFDLQPYLPYRIWPFSWLHMVGPHSSGQYSGGPLCCSCQQAVWSTVQTFPRACTLLKSLPPICLAFMLPQQSPALVFVSNTQAVTHPSTFKTQCCLTSVFKW